MVATPNDPLSYYARPGRVTDPGEHAPLFAGLPREIPALCKVVQGLLVHVFWAQRYGLELSQGRQQEVQIRPVDAKLARILALDSSPLTVARPLERRLVGNCRDFSVLLCAMLRLQGVPARARCGFATYFTPGHYEDHWVVEYWHAGEGRWVTVDPQLDALQRKALRIEFDPCDLPPGRFLTGGQAWQLCRTGKADADQFGIFDMHGLWFVRGDLVRDFLALNKVEILPWDPWGLMAGPEETAAAQDLAALDRIAVLTLGGNDVFLEVRSLYEGDERLRQPSGWQP